ncbi:MAG: stage III sporulation protein AF [Hungatella hathewayi]
MSALYSWVGNIVFYLIFITVVVNLLPNKKYEKYLKLFSGMVFILLVLKPLTGGLRLEDKIAYYFETISLQNESEDLRKELTGMEQQRLSQMITQYERAVANDVEAMAVDMECYPVYTDVTIDGTQDSPSFGSVTHIRMTVTREPPGEADSGGMGGSGAGSEPWRCRPAGTCQAGGAGKPVEIGEKTETAAEVPVPDETLNRLRRKVEGYYGLQTMDVEIQLEER